MKYFILTIFFISYYSCGGFNKNVMMSHDQKLFIDYTERYDENMMQSEKIQWADTGMRLFEDDVLNIRLVTLYQSLSVTTEDDLFREYLYYVLSDYYWKKNESAFFAYFASMLTSSLNEIQSNDTYVMYTTALRIIKLDSHINLREYGYRILLDNYRDQVDEILLLYELSMLYKSQYNLDKAIPVMKELLLAAGRTRNIDEAIDIDLIREEVLFSQSGKKWVFQDLSELINNIKYAVNTVNIPLLQSNISKVGFFIRFFNSSDEQWNVADIALNHRWIGRYIQFATQFEDISNENEVYLETKGWLLPQMNTWYLYFKKVEYPYDEKINGGWEWKGIYFGNWL